MRLREYVYARGKVVRERYIVNRKGHTGVDVVWLCVVLVRLWF